MKGSLAGNIFSSSTGTAMPGPRAQSGQPHGRWLIPLFTIGRHGPATPCRQQHGCTVAAVWARVSRRFAAAIRAPIVESGTLLR